MDLLLRSRDMESSASRPDFRIVQRERASYVLCVELTGCFLCVIKATTDSSRGSQGNIRRLCPYGYICKKKLYNTSRTWPRNEQFLKEYGEGVIVVKDRRLVNTFSIFL